MNKRRKTAVLALACPAVLALALTTVDLAAEHRAKDRIVEAARCRLGTASHVSASLSDPLAGLRAVAGDVGTVHVHADQVHRHGVDMTLQADLYGVSSAGRATGGSATATIAYAELGKRLGDGTGALTPGSDGTHLTLTGTTGRAGMPVTVVTDLSTTSHSITITPSTVSLLGRQMPVSALSSLPGTSAFADKLKPRTISVDGLPHGVRLAGADDHGLALRFSLTPADLASGKRGSCPSDT